MLSGLSVVALRHYDEIGLLNPDHVDPNTNYRRYSHAQLETAWLIAELRRIDLPLDGIRHAVAADSDTRNELLLAHREELRARGREVGEKVALTDKLLAKENTTMPTAEEVRLVAVNIGVASTDELAAAAAFWEVVLETTLEDWAGQGLSRQARVGRDAHAFFFNLRVRDETEAHFGHRAAFGIAVADLDAVRERALAAGALEHYPPTENEDEPRHFLIQDPVGNRAVIWQG